MAVPYTFSTATGSLPLSQLDSNFSTAITIGNTAVVLGDSITTVNNLTLANVAITSVSTAFPNGYLANSNVIVGTTTLTLGSTVTSINGLSLSNVTISSGNVTISNVTTTNVTATTANVTTANVGTLVVIGDATVGGNTTVTGNITAAKGTFTSANVTGTANVQVIAVTQNATVAGNVTITGNVSAANGTFTSANVSGTANVSTLAVVINTTIGGNATVTGNVTAAKLIPTGTSVTGNGLYLPAANALGLSTNGTNAVYIDSSQNVGIGTSSPASRLHVAGANPVVNIQNTGSTTGNGVLRFQGSAGTNQGGIGTNVNVGDVGNLEFLNGATTNMVLTSSGNVGIGTTTPVGRLTSEVNTSGTVVNTLTLNNNAAGAGNGTALNFYASNASQPFTGRINSLDDGNYGYHTVFSNKVGGSLGAGALTERMRIDSSGNVLVTSAAGLGYGTGSGGTVTQATSKGTAVTLNKPTGQITMNASALAANTTATFLVNNSLITATDTIIVNTSGVAGSQYNVWASDISAGTFYMQLRNITSGSLSEAVKINFAIIRGVTA